MQFNTSRCEVLRVSRACNQIPFTHVLNGAPLTETDHARYLGTHISKDLKWNKYIDVITAKAIRSLGFLKRNLKVSSSSLREKAYMGFVRPQLGYGSTIWDPRLGVENNGAYRVEMVQRHASRWTLKRYHNTSSVTDMLDDLGWRTLEQRRADTQLQQTHTSRCQRVPETSNSEDPCTLTATALFLYLPVAPLIVSHSTLEQSLSGTVCLSLSLRTLIYLNLNSPFLHSITVL